MLLYFRLESHLESANKDSAWLLLALISGHVPLKDPQFAMTFFNESIHTEAGVRSLAVLTIIKLELLFTERGFFQGKKL